MASAEEEDAAVHNPERVASEDPTHLFYEYPVKWNEDEMPPLLGGDQLRYKPEGVIELSGKLSDRAIDVIKKIGFGAFLDISLDCIDRNFSVWIASLCKPAKCHNEDVIVFNHDPNRPLVLTPSALAISLGLPRGVTDVPPEILECPNAGLKDALCAASEGKTANWTMVDVLKASSNARAVNDHMLEVRLFISALFSFAIFTTSALYLTGASMAAVYDIKKLVSTDWCRELIDHMTKCLKTFHQNRKVSSPVSFLLFCLDTIDCAETTGEDAMKIPRLKYYTEELVEKIIVSVKGGVKLKDWKNTVYGLNGIPEIQADEIQYIDYLCDVSISLTFWISIHTCYTFHTAFQVKRRSKLLKECPDHKKGPLKKRSRLDKKSNDESNEDQSPSEEEDDLFVRVPNMKKLLAPSLVQYSSDVATQVNDIVANHQSSWVKKVQEITTSEMMDCAKELKELLVPVKTYRRRAKTTNQSDQQLETFYQEHVLSKMNMKKEDESGQCTMKTIGTFELSVYKFVHVFRPCGEMSNWVVQALRIVWNKDWNGEKVMMNLSPVDYLLNKASKTRLLQELEEKVKKGHTKLIFLPVLRGKHWFLVVFDLDKNYKTVLDTMEGLGHQNDANLVVSTVEEYLISLGFVELTHNKQLVKQQTNIYDCGFYMLLFMTRIADGGVIDNIDDSTITQYRKHLAWAIFHHNEDNAIDLSESGSDSGLAGTGSGSSGESDGNRTGSGTADDDETGSGCDGSPRKFTQEGDKRRQYVEMVNLPDEQLLLRITMSKIVSPFTLAKRHEPDADKAIKLMKHIFEKYGNGSKMLIDDNSVAISGEAIKKEFGPASHCGAASYHSSYIA